MSVVDFSLAPSSVVISLKMSKADGQLRKVPNDDTGFLLASIGRDVIEIENDENVKFLSVENRGCRFPWEKPPELIVHKYYSYSTCVVQCHADSHIKLCNCTHHLMPVLKTVNRLHAKGFDKSGLVCDCLPSCVEPEYKVVSDTKGMDFEASQAKVSTQIVQTLRAACKILETKCSEDEEALWLGYLNKNIKCFSKLIKRHRDSTGTQRNLITNLGQLKHCRTILKSKNVVGAGLKGKIKRSNRVQWQDLNSAFNSRLRTGIIINLKHIDINCFLNDAFFLFKSRVCNILKQFPLIKVNVCFGGEFIKRSGDQIINEIKYFNTKNEVIDSGVDLKKWFSENVVDKILNKLSEFAEKDSGWALHKILNLEININKYEVGNGSSYIKLPEQIARKHACVNVKNFDNGCFGWSLVSALFPANTHVDRTFSYPYYGDVFNFANIELPMKLKDISKFEKLNAISINVYGLELIDSEKGSKYNTLPLRLTQNKLARHVNLLLIQNIYFPKQSDCEPFLDVADDNEIKYHYVWIKNLSRLVGGQHTKRGHTIFICDRCLNYFSTQIKLTEHEEYCQKLNKCKISFPKEDFVEFFNTKFQEKVPFVMYADFEAILLPITDNENLTKTSKYQQHEAFSAAYYFKCDYDDTLSFYKSYRGLGCIEWFAKEMSEVSKFVELKLKGNVPMDNSVDLKDATPMCHICNKHFIQGDIIVRDHNHLNGQFRGYAHQVCNLNYKNTFTVPVVFHNLTGYDSHFIIKDLTNFSRISLLPINKEKYISFTVYDNETFIKFRFIDSFRFMASSLDKLASYLTEFQNLKHVFLNLDDDKLKLLQRKGVFPYDFVDSFEKLDFPSLPEKSAFYNKLNDCDISENDYAHAHHVWREFGCQNLGEYSDLYLKTDILLLTDVFEQFRNSCFKTYGLDPAHYYTLPGYTWDCMLKFTGCRLQILKDVDMLLFIERGIRGGVSQCCNRYAEANNKYMGDTYDPSKLSKYLMYFDVNNLYGWAMCQYLPHDGFQWLENLDNFDVFGVSDESPVGYILEVDLEYPQNLHDLHKDLPFCPDHVKPPNSKLSKLMTTLTNKSNEIRLEISGKTVDRVRNPGITTTLKGYTSFNKNDVNRLKNSGWNIESPDCLVDVNDIATGEFNLCVPLNMILGFAEDFKKIIINLRQELILIRSNSDHNAIYNSTANEKNKITINKIVWKMPHISVADVENLKLLELIENGRELEVAFRNWELIEYPLLQKTKNHTWNVKSATQLEKPRYVIVGFQTDRKNNFHKNSSLFDNCNLKNIKLYLNSEIYPYDNLNIDYDKNQYSMLYEMYLNFQQSYYDRENEPLLNPKEYKSIAPVVVIDCSRQNEILNSGTVEVRLEFETTKDMPDNTSAFCLILHDRLVYYTPLSGIIRDI
ncbi:unnamed protein product [Brassicogethes aeneus]|uniref:Double jelly roll-like domain-containing protein n=1 Tax=Brassicogethes aeneus TaxID=1431903 RepID=A0A9P0FDM6_BRAAE|nr:unnamed protein product [Brassicogethes aeneus]